MMKMNIPTHWLSNQKDFSRTENLIQISVILLSWLSGLVEGGNEWSLSEIMELIKGKCRLCPGYHFAFSTIWLAAATILATFNLSKAVDKDGRVVEPSREYDSGLTR